jgi:hypothetical protein
LVEEVAPQGSVPAGGYNQSVGSGAGLAEQKRLTVANRADLRQSSCAGECQHGSGEECVGSHIVEVVVLMVESWKKSVVSWIKEVLKKTTKSCMALERERVGCEE